MQLPIDLQERHLSLNANSPIDAIVLRPNLKLAIAPASRVPLEHFCFRSPDMVQELDAFMTVASSKQTFLDVGALHGIFSLVFTSGRTNAKAIAVDPSPLAFPILLYNIYRNRANVIPIELALADVATVLPMRFEWHHLIALDRRLDVQEIADSMMMRIQTCLGDDLCANNAFEPDLLKIDVEGYECRCLVGLSNTIDRLRPTIFLEIHPEFMKVYGDSPHILVDFFRRKNYRFNRLTGEPLTFDSVALLTEITRLVVAPI